MKKTKLYIEAYPLSEDKISGIGHMTLELIRALEKHPKNQVSFELVLVINKDRKEKLSRWGFKKVSIKTIPLPTRLFNALWKFDLLPPMDMWLGRGVYIFPNYKNWRLVFSKSLTFVCDISYLLYPEFVSPKNQKFLEKNVKKWVKRTDKVLAISKNAQTEIINNLHIAAEKTLLVPCGVDTTVFYKRPKDEIERLKITNGIAKEYILYLGNIEPRKNIERLLNAYKLLPDELRKKYTLVLVGGGGWLNEPIMDAVYKSQQEGFDVLKPANYIPEEDLPALHSGASMLVHPALYEGFGISPLQAMACGTPVVVANNSSLPEVVGDAALFIDTKNEHDISDKIQRLLTDASLREQLTEKGKRRVQQYSWSISAEILVNELVEKQ
jgi:glycosyltransferase involved in cell wall biosynthesis